MITNGALYLTHANFSFKTLFTKPLKFVIQIVTGRNSHCAISNFTGYVVDATGDPRGFWEKIKLKLQRKYKPICVRVRALPVWLEHYLSKTNKVEVFNLIKPLTQEEIELGDKYIQKCLEGFYYSIALGVFMPIDNSFLRYNPKKGLNCSKFAEGYYIAIGRLKPRSNGSKDDPNELYDRMVRMGLIEKRGFYV